jgi:hypothetical protein
MQAILAGAIAQISPESWLEPLMANEGFRRPRERREIPHHRHR